MDAPGNEWFEGGRVKSVLTTGQVAEICNVAPRTVSKWFDGGQLKGYRIPGSRDRRIPLGELLRFMRAHGIPLANLGLVNRSVLIIDADGGKYRRLTDRLLVEKVEVKVVDNSLAAGAALAWSMPAVVVLNLSTVALDPAKIAKWLKSEPWAHSIRLVGLVVAGKLKEQRAELIDAGFDRVLSANCRMEEIASIIDETLA